MSSTKAMIFGTGIAVAAINSAKAFPSVNSTSMVDFSSGMNSTNVFSNSTAWTEDLMTSASNSTNITSTSTTNSTNFVELDQVHRIYESMLGFKNNSTTFSLEDYCNATVPISSLNINATMPAASVNATMPVFNATMSEVHEFPCGKTLSDSFAPANLHISTRGPRLTNYDLSSHQMHQVSVANITGDGFVNNSTIIGSEFLNNADFLYDSEDLTGEIDMSNYTAVDTSTNQWASSGTFVNSNSTECAHCEDFSHGDDQFLDPVTVMSSYISGHMKEHGRMHGLLTIVADVGTEAYNYTVANLTSTLQAIF